MVTGNEKALSLPTDDWNRKYYWDMRKVAWNCARCSTCKWVDVWEVKDARFAKICPSSLYYLFDAYSCQGRMDLSLALYVMRSITSAVATLHDAGVIHRDLKPTNVLFDRGGEARVCDFGLACEFDAGAYKGNAEEIGGSPLYMAPEMFDGHVSPHSDVYALGVMLFEVLVGSPPFSAQSISDRAVRRHMPTASASRP